MKSQYSTNEATLKMSHRGQQAKTNTEIGAFVLFPMLLEPCWQVRYSLQTQWVHADYSRLNGQQKKVGLCFCFFK